MPTNPAKSAPPISSTLTVARTISKAFQNLGGDGRNAAYHETLKVGSHAFRIEIQSGHYTLERAQISLWANDSWEEVHTLFPPHGFTSLPPGMKTKVTRNGDHPLDMDLVNEDREELLRVAMEVVFRD